MIELGLQTCGPAKCHLGHSKHLPDRVVELSGLAVPDAFRRRGWANRLLRRVCGKADTAFLPLVLMLDKPEDRLFNLYSPHGFVVFQTSPVYLMVRLPRAQNAKNG